MSEGLTGLQKGVEKSQQQLAEAGAFSEQINNLLRHDEELKNTPYIPIKKPADLFNCCKDGVLLARLIYTINSSCINVKEINYKVDRSKISVPGAKDAWLIAANNNMVVEGAKRLGCKIVNIGSEDILEGNEDLVLGLVWQVIRSYLMKSINLISHPELIRLLKQGESIDKLMKLSSEEILIRWFNYHLRRAGVEGAVKNFGPDVANSVYFVHLLKEVAREDATDAGIEEVLETEDLIERAEKLLEVCEELDCREFATAYDIVHQHARLNLALTATIFNNYIGIHLPTEDEIEELFKELEDLRRKVKEIEGSQHDQTIQGVIVTLNERKKTLEGIVQEREKQVLDKEQKLIEVNMIYSDEAKEKEREIQSLAAILKEKQSQHDEIDNNIREVEVLKKKVISDHNEIKKELQKEIDELTALQAELEKKIAELREIAEGKGSTMFSVNEEVLAFEKTVSEYSRSIQEYVDQSNATIVSYSNAISNKNLITHPEYIPENDEKSLKSVYDSHKATCDLLVANHKDIVTAFEKVRAENQSRLSELNNILQLNVGPESGDQQQLDAMTNMKRLLELIIEKCKKQAIQIRTLEVTIQKKNMLNDVMAEKIRDIAEKNVAKNKRKSKKK